VGNDDANGDLETVGDEDKDVRTVGNDDESPLETLVGETEEDGEVYDDGDSVTSTDGNEGDEEVNDGTTIVGLFE